MLYTIKNELIKLFLACVLWTVDIISIGYWWSQWIIEVCSKAVTTDHFVKTCCDLIRVPITQIIAVYTDCDFFAHFQFVHISKLPCGNIFRSEIKFKRSIRVVFQVFIFIHSNIVDQFALFRGVFLNIYLIDKKISRSVRAAACIHSDRRYLFVFNDLLKRILCLF